MRYFKSEAVKRNYELGKFRRSHGEKARRAKRRRQGLPAFIDPRIFRDNIAPRVGWLWEEFFVPKVLDLVTQSEQTLRFFNDFSAMVRSHKNVKLVFEDTAEISSECLVYLVAQIHKLRLQYGGNSVTGTYPKSKKVERLMTDSGFFKVLNVRPREIKPTGRNSTRYLECLTDTKPSGPKIKSMRQSLLGDDLQMPKVVKMKVFRALSEAMLNVSQHAYQAKKGTRARRIKGRWWLGAQLSRKTNSFTLTFYDAGAGIPKTLPRKYPMEMIRQWLSVLPGVRPDDAQMIKAAVELGRSQTEKSHRGKGLMDIHKLIQQVGEGCLTIYSRQGRYRYENANATSKNDKFAIEGTLIKWDLPLNKAVEELWGDAPDEAELAL